MKYHLSKLLVAFAATLLFGSDSIFAQSPAGRVTDPTFNPSLARIPQKRIPQKQARVVPSDKDYRAWPSTRSTEALKEEK